jgi:hypothetical protein
MNSIGPRKALALGGLMFVTLAVGCARGQAGYSHNRFYRHSNLYKSDYGSLYLGLEAQHLCVHGHRAQKPLDNHPNMRRHPPLADIFT